MSCVQRSWILCSNLFARRISDPDGSRTGCACNGCAISQFLKHEAWHLTTVQRRTMTSHGLACFFGSTEWKELWALFVSNWTLRQLTERIERSTAKIGYCNQEPKAPEYGAEDAGRAKQFQTISALPGTIQTAWQRADGLSLDQAAEEKEAKYIKVLLGGPELPSGQDVPPRLHGSPGSTDKFDFDNGGSGMHVAEYRHRR